MLHTYRYLVPAFTCCTMIAIAGMAHAATTITPDAPPTAAEVAAAHQTISANERISGHPLTLHQRVALEVAAAQSSHAAPPVPTELESMRLLYGEAYRKNGSVVETPDPQGLRVNKEPGYHHTITEYVTPWLTATVTLNGSRYFIATGQGHSIEDPSHPDDASHAQSAYISAIWFVLQGNRWVVAGKTLNLAVDGSFGMVTGKPWSPFPQTVVLKNAVLLVADEGGYMNQGFSSSWYPIYQFSMRGLQFLGKVPSGADNTGADAMPVVSIDGKVVAAATTVNDHPQITIAYSGRTELQNKPVDLHHGLCTFVYRQDAAHPHQSGFKPTTPKCKAIVASMSF